MSDKNDEILEKLNNFIDSSENEMIFLESLLTKHKALSPENGGDGEEENLHRAVAARECSGGQGKEDYMTAAGSPWFRKGVRSVSSERFTSNPGV